MTNSLKNNPELIDKLLMLVRGQGMRVATAARQLGLKPRTCQEFFAQQKEWMKQWWYEMSDRTPLQSRCSCLGYWRGDATWPLTMKS